MFVAEPILWLVQTLWEGIMPIKRILEAIGATVALVCVVIVKAFIELTLMDRAAKRRHRLNRAAKRENQSQQPELRKETERIRRAG